MPGMATSAIPRKNFVIDQGKTFQQVIRWESEPFVYAAIASISRTAPVSIETQDAHGLVDGWRVAVVSAQGMRQINAENSPPIDSDFHRATIVDETTVELNDINAADFSVHTANTGYLQFYSPKSLAGCTARMTIRDRTGGAELMSLTTENGRITLDDTEKTITLRIEADDTAAISWLHGVYDLEIEDSDGFVTGLYQGAVTVNREETT